MEMDDDGEAETRRENNSENGFNVVNSQDLNKTELDAMRGDIIGDTVYSSKWILETLMSLSKVDEEKWSETLENDLCMLWDMTAEKDIVFFLKDNDFLRIAEFILKISSEPRLTEIIIGIIGNMCCQRPVLEAVGDDDSLITIIFNLLSSDDTETLIQILRLLHTAVWDMHENPKIQWLRHLRSCEFLGDSLSFILQSSTNEDLLTATVELLQSIATVEMPDGSFLLIDLIKLDQLIPALLESFDQAISKNDTSYSKKDLKFIENWLSIFCNIMQRKLEFFSSDACDDFVTKIIRVLVKILQPYEHSANLFPLEERLALCIHDCVEMVSWFQRNTNRTDSQINRVILTIMHDLRLAIKRGSEMEGIMNFNEADELKKHLEKYWLEITKVSEKKELLEMIQQCRKDVKDSLMDVAKEYSQEYPDNAAKLLFVESISLDQ